MNREKGLDTDEKIGDVRDVRKHTKRRGNILCNTHMLFVLMIALLTI